MEKVKILCVCGTGIATSTVVHSAIEKICKKHNIPFDIVQAKTLEVSSKLSSFRPNLIVSTTHISAKIGDIPMISGLPFLTGVGLAKIEQEIIDVLTK